MKKRFFGLGVAALALVLGLVQVQQASALDNLGFFASTSERDTWLLKVMESHPYYYYAPNANQSALAGISLLSSEINYRPDGGAAVDPNQDYFSLLFITKGPSEKFPGAMMIYFHKTKAEVEERMALDDPGPFEAGSTAASRRDAAKRILGCLTSWNADRSATLN